MTDRRGNTARGRRDREDRARGPITPPGERRFDRARPRRRIASPERRSIDESSTGVWHGRPADRHARRGGGIVGNQSTGGATISPTLTALTGFVSWSLFLLVLMEVVRSKLVIARTVPPNGFVPDNSNLSPFMQRLARAHANCVEGLPIFGGLMIVAALSGKSAVTDSLAYAFLGARIVQSLVHLSSGSSAAVIVRFSVFSVQMAIGVYWAFRLLAG